MSKQVTLENTLAGGFGLPTGQIVPPNGSIIVEPEIWEEVKTHPVILARVESGALIVDGKGRKKDAGGDRDENGDTSGMAELRKVFDAAYEKQGKALAASVSEVTALQGKVTDLEGKLAAKVAEIDGLKAGNGNQPAALKAEHHGGGKFNVTQGENVIVTGLSKADADAFNAMSAEEKAAYVDASN